VTSALANAILITWRRNAAYSQRLVSDLTDAQFAAQPIPGRVLNHPAWILSHLTLYTTIAAAMLRDQPFEDPSDHQYGAKSEPRPDPAAYAARTALINQYKSAHDDAEAALLAAPDRVFSTPTPLERWRALHPTTGDMLVTLMVKHESAHLGQLSAWRRAMGLPRVAM
jgi:uncharacterized damage-inducible protein DinB